MPDPDPGEIIDGEIVPDPPADAQRAPHVARPVDLPMPDGYTADGVPTLAYVRDKISTALGAAEFFDQSAAAVDEQARQEELRAAAAAKLASLREELARQQIAAPPPDRSDQ